MPSGYDAFVMHERGRWQRLGLLMVVALLTVTTFATVVHRHIGADEQGCVLCHARHDPGIESPAASLLAAPCCRRSSLVVAEFQFISRDSIPLRPGRAPPSSF
jgi:hypothetical protein